MVNLKQAFKDMADGYNKYIGNSCEILEALNGRFYEDEIFEFIQDIVYQPGDGFVLVWDGNNSVFDIDEILKIKTREQMDQYLLDNQIS